ncbi:hypothetical protein JCM11641_005294 [Rhodosporidiobolus odoratus]
MPPPPPASPTGQDRLLGTLIVVVLRAKNLTNRVRIGKQNPYATITYGLHKKRTRPIERGGQQPEWDEEFRFEILREGLGGEEQSAAQGAVVDAKGGVGPTGSTKGSGLLGNKLDKVPPPSVLPPQATVSAPGKRILKFACFADDSREPKLIGEGELDLEETLKKGKYDEWIKLERKNRYAGELFLELTWYTNDPRPVKSTRREASEASPSRAGTVYGGAGSRVEDYEGGDESEHESWDGGSQVGLSGAGSTAPPAVDLGVDYPDPDLAPLNRSMSAMAVSRPPLPQPPASVPPTNSAYHLHRLSASQSFPHYPNPSAAGSSTPAPHGAYGVDEHARRSSHPYASHSYSPAPPPHQQAYSGYPGAGEFGTYQQQYAQHMPSSVSQPQMGEFEQLAHQHYASQSFNPLSQSASQRPLPRPAHSTTPAPSNHPAYDPYAAPHYPTHTSHTPYPPQPPFPPIPPSGSGQWNQSPMPPASTVSLSSAASYTTMPHSASQGSMYGQPPQPPQPPAFSPPPPPPSIATPFSSYAPPPPPPPPQHPSYALPPVFSPPPPPSLQSDYSAPPLRPTSAASYATAQHALPPIPPPVPPLPVATPQYAQQAYDASPPPSIPSPYGHGSPAYPSSSEYHNPPSAYAHSSCEMGSLADASSRPPLPQPPATTPSRAGMRPLPGMFGGR